MILDGLGPTRGIRVSQPPLIVAHDKHVGNAVDSRPLLQLGKILLVLRLVHEELVHILHAVYSEILTGHAWKVQVVHPLPEQRLVQRPLRQRYPEERPVPRNRAIRNGHPRRCQPRLNKQIPPSNPIAQNPFPRKSLSWPSGHPSTSPRTRV